MRGRDYFSGSRPCLVNIGYDQAGMAYASTFR